MTTEQKIYLDSNATTKLDDKVIRVIEKALKEGWGNPSCGYEEGVASKNFIDESRKNVGLVANCQPDDVVFMSGGTEANTSVIHSVIKYYKEKFGNNNTKCPLPHIISSNLEHDSIKKPLQDLFKEGKLELSIVSSQNSGAVNPDDVCSEIKENTILVTIMHANNETGVIQPIQKISEGIAKKNTNRSLNDRVFFHTDAAQTIGKMKVDMDQLGVDYLTVVGHKFHGPRIGALCIKNLMSSEVGSPPLYPLFLGGGQEKGLRSGTENTPMIAGLGEACLIAYESSSNFYKHMFYLRNKFESELVRHLGADKIHFNGKSELSERLPNTCNFSIIGENKTGRQILEGTNFYIKASTGSACHAKSIKPSAILLSIGIPENIARNAIRVSMDRNSKEADIIRAAELIAKSSRALDIQ